MLLEKPTLKSTLPVELAYRTTDCRQANQAEIFQSATGSCSGRQTDSLTSLPA